MIVKEVIYIVIYIYMIVKEVIYIVIYIYMIYNIGTNTKE